jgi:hypothetical protein
MKIGYDIRSLTAAITEKGIPLTRIRHDEERILVDDMDIKSHVQHDPDTGHFLTRYFTWNGLKLEETCESA